MKNAKAIASTLTAVVIMAVASGNVLADDRELVGVLTGDGYENEYFGVKCALSSEYTIQCRSVIQPEDPLEIINASNSDSTIDLLKSEIDLNDATVFTAIASNEVDNMVVTVASPGFGYDTWDSEETVAFGTIDSVKEDLENTGMEQDIDVENISVDVAQVDFIGEKHSGLEYSCTINGTPVYGKGVILISDDSKYAFFLQTVALDQGTVAEMLNSFVKL